LYTSGKWFIRLCPYFCCWLSSTLPSYIGIPHHSGQSRMSPIHLATKPCWASICFSWGRNAEFLIHLGDIKRGPARCDKETLDEIDMQLRLSPIPVFVVVGDNEFNDCKNISPAKALSLWRKTFARYDKKHWEHKLKVGQMPNRPEIFYFIHKNTLYFGLNVVGGIVHDQNEWDSRHADQLTWVKRLMLQNKEKVSAVVLFGHANPGPDQSSFFNPFILFLRFKFPRKIPALYLCGDSHKWSYDLCYHNVGNLLRVRLTRGLVEPIVRFTIDPDSKRKTLNSTFNIQRFL
jgi:hypothetical protein